MQVMKAMGKRTIKNGECEELLECMQDPADAVKEVNGLQAAAPEGHEVADRRARPGPSQAAPM